jgi:hypothetical protein
MAIPESQLNTWSRQGAVTTAKNTYESVRTALAVGSAPIRNLNYEVYLQGSYKNDTNIRGDSDVDIVVQLNETFQSDRSALSSTDAIRQQQSYPSAAYGWADFRRDVLVALRAYYGAPAVSEGRKSLKVAAFSGRLSADVIPCLQYRKYRRFASVLDEDYIEGMTFYSLPDWRQIVNYPKPHYNNGVTKNGATVTNGLYKPAVRMFKNARTYLEDTRAISTALAPSYFLECLLYNAPASAFGPTCQATYCNIVNWLSRSNLSGCICQNGQLPLFGGTPEQWSILSAQTLIAAFTDLWNRS